LPAPGPIARARPEGPRPRLDVDRLAAVDGVAAEAAPSLRSRPPPLAGLGCVGREGSPVRYAGSSIPTRGRTARSTVRDRLRDPWATRAVAMISASPSWLPGQVLVDRAGGRARPAPTAWMDRSWRPGPTTSPPAKDALATRGPGPASATMPEKPAWFSMARALGQDRRDRAPRPHRTSNRRGGLSRPACRGSAQ